MSLSQKGMKLYFENGVYLGEVIADVDGYYKFWPETRGGGYWDEYLLRSVADHLKELNAAWDEQIQNDPALGGRPMTMREIVDAEDGGGPENNDKG